MTDFLRPAALSLLLLAACAEETSTAPAVEEPVAAAPEPQGPPVVRTSITLGTFEGRVSDLALYEAPDFGFQGAVIAANGAAGIAVISVDGAASVVITPEVTADRLDITYAIDPNAGSILALSRDGTLAAYSLTGDLLTTIDIPGGAAEDICASGDLSAVLVDGDIQIIEVGTDDVGEATLSMSAVIETGGIDGCDGIGAGLVFAGDEAQLILNAEGNLEATGQPIDAMPVISSGGVAVGVSVANGLLRVGTTPLLIETADNAPLLPRLAEATGGNFGGVLRDGAIAILDDSNTLHLAPWSGAASAAELEPSSDSRRPIEVTEESEFAIDADDPVFTPQRELPGFEEQELPEPPGQ